MPPKRKAPPEKPTRKSSRITGNVKFKGNDDVPEDTEPPPPKKAKKAQKAKSSASAAKKSTNEKKIMVRWARPDIHPSKVMKFAQPLFDRPWAELVKSDLPRFRGPQLLSPLQPGPRSIENRAVSDDMRNLYNVVQNKGNTYLDRVENHDDGLLEIGDGTPISLERDVELRATIQLADGTKETASIHIVRKLHKGSNKPEQFLKVPPGITVTVNGTAYFNNAEQTGENTEDLYIGFLGNFAIIELLCSPAFLWRNRQKAAEQDTDEKPNKLEERVSKPEGAKTKIVLVNSVDDVGGVDGVDSSNDSWPGSERLSHRISSSAHREQLHAVEPSSQQSSESTSSNNASIDAIQSHGDQQSGINGSSMPSSSPPPIALPPLEDSVSHVLLAISALNQDKHMGFCTEVEDTLIRPGQPWLLPVDFSHGTVLVVLQTLETEEGVRICIHVLDPLEWRKDKKTRQDIWDTVSGWDILQRWMAGIGFAVNEVHQAIPSHAGWTPSAIALDETEAFMITILNAWALAMGYELNSAWSPTHNGTSSSRGPGADAREDFFDEAKKLVQLASLDSALHWNNVHEFLTRHHFVKGEHLPPGNRRFNLKATPAETLKKNQIGTQKEYDRRIRTLRTDRDRGDLSRTEREKSMTRARLLSVKLSETYRYQDSRFPSDEQSEVFKARVMKDLIRRGLWDRDASSPRLEALTLKRPSLPESSETQNDRHRKRIRLDPSSPRIAITQDVSNFQDSRNPCRYFEKAFSQNIERYKLKADTEPQDFDKASLNRSIASVVQAIAHAEAPNRSLECIDYDRLDPHAPQAINSEDSQANTKFYVRRLLIIPWTAENRSDGTFKGTVSERNVLVVVRPEEGSSQSGDFRINFLDFSPWLSTLETRNSTVDKVVKMLRNMVRISKSNVKSIHWSCGPPLEQNSYWHSACYTILSAWAEAFGLQLNYDFRERTGFFSQAGVLITLVLNGLADWKLLYSFLRCHEFVKDHNIQDTLKFSRTVAEDGLKQSHAELLEKDTGEQPRTKSVLRQGSEHIKVFPTDSWNEIDDFFVRLPFLLRSEMRPVVRASEKGVAQFSKNNLKAMYEVYCEHFKTPNDRHPGRKDTGIQSESLPESNGLSGDGVDPCGAFKEELEDLRKRYGHGIKYAAKSIKNSNIGPYNAEDWVETDFPGRAIASVTLAITLANDPAHGYSYFSPDHVDELVRLFSAPDSDKKYATEAMAQFAGVARPYFSPLLMPVLYNNHLVLIIIQLDQASNPEFLILDSLNSNPKEPKREEQKLNIHESMLTWTERGHWYHLAVVLLQKSHWGAPLSEDPLEAPDHAKYIPCPRQNNGWACGYHTTLNAWAVALGLKINTEFDRNWEVEGAKKELVDVMSLAIIGKATLTLIKNYLDCIQYIEPGQTISKDKTFKRTVINVQHGNRDLEDHFDTLGLREFELHFSGQIPWNRVNLDEERPQEISQPPTSMLKPGTKKQQLHTTLRPYSSSLDPDQEEGATFFGRFWKDVVRKSDTVPEILRKFQDMVEHSSDLVTLHETEPGQFFQGQMEAYRKFTAEHRFQKLGAIQVDENMILGQEEQVACIAAVVQAIDRHQMESYGTEKTFAGGLSLATYGSLEYVQSSETDDVFVHDSARASRPRRCWLMPYQFYIELKNDKRVKHSLLAVLQEEEVSEKEVEPRAPTRFCVYIFDGRPKHTSKRQDEIYRGIQKVARALKWTTHRNRDGYVTFQEKVNFVDVSEPITRKASGWQTVLIAWILALGLTPHPNSEFSKSSALPQNIREELAEICNLAIRGIMGWRVLAAWLIHRNLVMEQDISSVPNDRQFLVAEEQVLDSSGNNTRLEDYLDTATTIDDVLAMEAEFDVPYDRSSNVNFSRWLRDFPGGSDYDGNDDDELPKELQRGGDDMGFLDSVDTSLDLQYYQELAQRKWEERRYQERLVRRSVLLQKMKDRGRDSGIRKRAARIG